MKVPVSPKTSAVVPIAVYVPAARVPVVVILPLDETMSPEPPPVLAKVTAPMLPVVVSWSVKPADPDFVTEPDVGAVWAMVTGWTTRM